MRRKNKGAEITMLYGGGISLGIPSQASSNHGMTMNSVIKAKNARAPRGASSIRTFLFPVATLYRNWIHFCRKLMPTCVGDASFDI